MFHFFDKYQVKFIFNPFWWRRFYQWYNQEESSWGYVYEWKWQFGPLVIGKWAVWRREEGVVQ
jgi:hypothetical protein